MAASSHPFNSRPDLKFLHGLEKTVELYISKPELGNEKAIQKAKAEIAALQAKRDKNTQMLERFQLYLTCPLDGGAAGAVKESQYATGGKSSPVVARAAVRRFQLPSVTPRNPLIR